MEPILVVDDSPDVCFLLVRILRKMGYAVECVDHGAAALALAQKLPLRLIILDYMLPDLNGLEVLAKLRDNSLTSNIPVVMFSAISDPAVIANAREKGAVDYWVKGEFSNLNQLGDRLAMAVR